MTEQTLPPDSVGIVETQYFTFADDAPFVLESGASLGPITLAYQTYGQLNADRSNVVLILHALSGGADAAGYRSLDDTKSGWWDTSIGPGKAFDTDRFFVICSNIIGSCYGSTGPSSLNPATGKLYGLSFPVVTIGDIVRGAGAADRSLGDRAAALRGGRLDGGDAGVGMGRASPGADPGRHPAGHDRAQQRHADCLERGGPAGDLRRPDLARRRLLRERLSARRRPGRGAR